MFECWKDDDYTVSKEKMMPISVKDSKGVVDVDELLIAKSSSVSFQLTNVATFSERGAYVVLDFGMLFYSW